jgi:hypothetical protein
MFVTVFPPIVDAALAAVALGVTAFWMGVFLLAGIARLVDRVAPSPFDPALPAQRPAPSAPIGVLEKEVAP